MIRIHLFSITVWAIVMTIISTPGYAEMIVLPNNQLSGISGQAGIVVQSEKEEKESLSTIDSDIYRDGIEDTMLQN